MNAQTGHICPQRDRTVFLSLIEDPNNSGLANSSFDCLKTKLKELFMNKFRCFVFFKTLTRGFGANDVSSYASGLPEQKFSFQFSIHFTGYTIAYTPGVIEYLLKFITKFYTSIFCPHFVVSFYLCFVLLVLSF